jgi:hypothetical protein
MASRGFESPRLYSMRPSKPFGFEGLTRGRPFLGLPGVRVIECPELVEGHFKLFTSRIFSHVVSLYFEVCG